MRRSECIWWLVIFIGTFGLIPMWFIAEAQAARSDITSSEYKLLLQKIEANEAIKDRELAALKLALEIQAQEYSRRLEMLNHEAAKLALMQATYLPREVFENFEKLVDEDKKTVAQELRIIREWKAGIVAMMGVYAGLMVLVMFIINYFKGWKRPVTTQGL